MRKSNCQIRVMSLVHRSLLQGERERGREWQLVFSSGSVCGSTVCVCVCVCVCVLVCAPTRAFVFPTPFLLCPHSGCIPNTFHRRLNNSQRSNTRPITLLKHPFSVVSLVCYRVCMGFSVDSRSSRDPCSRPKAHSTASVAAC